MEAKDEKRRGCKKYGGGTPLGDGPSQDELWLPLIKPRFKIRLKKNTL